MLYLWATVPDATTTYQVVLQIGGVLVEGYGNLLDPASQVLVTPTQKLVTDASGFVKGSFGTGAGQWNVTSGIIQEGSGQLQHRAGPCHTCAGRHGRLLEHIRNHRRQDQQRRRRQQHGPRRPPRHCPGGHLDHHPTRRRCLIGGGSLRGLLGRHHGLYGRRARFSRSLATTPVPRPAPSTPSFGTNPDNTSTFALYPVGPVQVQYGTGFGQLSATAGILNVNTLELAGQTVFVAGTAGVTFPGVVGSSSLGDPLSAVVPGAYAAGTAGYVLGTNLNAAITTCSTLTQAQVTGGSYALNADGSGNLTISGITAAALAQFFTTNSTTTYSSAVNGSVVKEIATNT